MVISTRFIIKNGTQKEILTHDLTLMIREQDAVGIDHTLIVASGDEETAMSFKGW
jgi:hypothetical protein